MLNEMVIMYLTFASLSSRINTFFSKVSLLSENKIARVNVNVSCMNHLGFCTHLGQSVFQFHLQLFCVTQFKMSLFCNGNF